MSSSLFCGNLAFTSTTEELRDHCDTLGVKGISSVEVIERNGRSRGWALIHFSTPAAASAAQAILNNSELASRTLNVRENREDGSRPAPAQAQAPAPRRTAPAPAQQQHHQPRPQRSAAPAPRSTSPGAPCPRLFVSNLPWEVTHTQLRELFSRFKPVEAEIEKRPSGRSKGFGTVDFSSTADAQAALDALNGHVLDGRELSVHFDKEGRVAATACLFVGNLPWSADDQTLRDMFKGHTLVSARVQSAAGRSRGFGFVEFATPEEAAKVLDQKREFTHEGRNIFCRFNRW